MKFYIYLPTNIRMTTNRMRKRSKHTHAPRHEYVGGAIAAIVAFGRIYAEEAFREQYTRRQCSRFVATVRQIDTHLVPFQRQK